LNHSVRLADRRPVSLVHRFWSINNGSAIGDERSAKNGTPFKNAVSDIDLSRVFYGSFEKTVSPGGIGARFVLIGFWWEVRLPNPGFGPEDSPAGENNGLVILAVVQGISEILGASHFENDVSSCEEMILSRVHGPRTGAFATDAKRNTRSSVTQIAALQNRTVRQSSMGGWLHARLGW
jgi:hypothetical protein